MTTQKDDLVWEIQDLQTEIDEHVRKIVQLKSIVKVKEQQLQEFPITLQRIIAECVISHNSGMEMEVLENILDRVEVEWMTNKVGVDKEEPIVDVVEYHRGWDNCLKELKGRLRE
jgi:uncharacterized coiled-coil DUF342 family protein